mmetsp:Transcript_48852/g.56150  ORF Transcript_48852/g.56150 Transcript_48852/m.56150 type:complete len:273 (+) Transcript_48852:41-859(+)
MSPADTGVVSRLNNFYWQHEPEITTNQTSSRRIRPGTLLAFRIASIFISLGTLLAGLINSPATYFAYISNWAVAATMLTFVTLTISHVCQVTRRFSISTTDFEELAKIERYEMRMFKAASVLFEVTLTSEIVICVIFWTMVFPDSNKTAGVFEIIDLALVYCGMITLLFIEYVAHRMKFHTRHYAVVIQVIVLYMIINLTLASFGLDVYSWVHNWATWYRCLFISAAILLSFLAFFVLKYLEDVKERRVFKKDEKMINLMVGVPSLGNYTQL